MSCSSGQSGPKNVTVAACQAPSLSTRAAGLNGSTSHEQNVPMKVKSRVLNTKLEL